MRATKLPASYAEHAPASCHQLQALIAETYGISTAHVHMARGWINRDGTRAWAFLEVANETQRQLLHTKSQWHEGQLRPAQHRMAHASLPGMTAHAAQITLDMFPNLIFHQLPTYGTV